MTAPKPLAIDLFCGLGGWTEGLLAEGWDVIGFDIEAHAYGDERYPGKLVLQDVLTLHGAQFKDADLIVASPPCQEFSYMAMPWTRAKQIARALRGEDVFPEGYNGSRTTAELTRLFDACFRIQREASEAAGRRVPMVVENVKGAQPWVGRAPWSFGSYFLWGDIPALMPGVVAARKNGGLGGVSWFAIGSPGQTSVGQNPDGRKNPGFRFDGSGKSFQSESVERHVEGVKVPATAGRRADPGKGARFTSRDCGDDVRKGPRGAWFNDDKSAVNRLSSSGSKSPARKAASARIAKIPFALSSHIARVYKPRLTEAA